MSSVQPITPYQPTTGVLAALQAAPTQPKHPTTASLISTVPTQGISDYNAIPQLPGNTITTLASQQAYGNILLTKQEKLELGVLDGYGGATLDQLSQRGQYVKPGAGEFLQQLMQENPTLPFTKLASRVCLTGSGGVATPASLIKNTNAQLDSISTNISNVTTDLTNGGVLTGNETPTQSSGVIMAATVVGAQDMIALLSNPKAVPAVVGSSGSIIGNAIASGSYASSAADRTANGVDGVVTSLSSITNGVLNTLSSGITDFAQRAPGGLASIVSTTSGIMQSAFNIAEKSFGSLKAGIPNTIGGLTEVFNLQPSKTVTAVLNQTIASEELLAAEAEFSSAKKALNFDDSPAALDAVRTAEAKISQAKQKLAAAANNIVQGNAAAADGISAFFAGASAQAVSSIANATASGALNAPTSENTGLNSIPGGAGAFMNQLGNATSNIVGTIKSAASNLSSAVGSVADALTNPAKLAGDIVNNAKQALGSITDKITGGLGNVAGAVNTAINGAAGVANSLSSAATTGISGLASQMISSLTSLGDAPGQIKNAITALNTYQDVKAVMSSVLNSAMDSRVPPPSFEEVKPSFKPDKYAKAQVMAQEKLDELLAKRSDIAFKINQYSEQYEFTKQASILPQIEGFQAELAAVDVQIREAQKSYERLITG